MSSRSAELSENRGWTNDYMDNWWNPTHLKVASTVVWILLAVVGATTCKKQPAEGEQSPAHSVPVQAESVTPLLPGLPGLREHPIR